MTQNGFAEDHDDELEEEEGGFRIDDIYVPPPPPASCTFDPTGPRLMIYKIENINFKSYAGKRVIGPFHKNFTAIVGPNGSGKSNVIDSMLFVFGYRAQKIRSKKVGVLIHNSTNHKNLESCTVNVHFQRVIDVDENAFEVVPNSAFVVGRTAHRDNSSYYTVDGRRCTFKEATKLLRSFGIDLDHNRFLILQGEVEQIALMKAKAQTEHDTGMLEFLEDIIGSSRYKEPIELLGKRVEELTEERTEKLNRVKLVEKDMEELKGARDEAVEYLKLENEIATVENQLYQHYRFKEQAAEAEAAKQVEEGRTQLADLQKELDAQLQAKKQQEAEFKKAFKECEKKEKEVEAKKQEYAELERRDLQIRENIKHTKQKGKDLEKSMDTAKQKVDECQKLPAKHQKDIEKLQTKKEKLEKEKVVAEEKLAEVMESLKTQTVALQEQKEVHEQELLGLQKGVSEKKSRYELAKSELDICNSTYERETSRLREIETNLEKVTTSLNEKSSALTKLEKLVPERQAQLQQQEAELARVTKEQEEAQAQLRLDRRRVEEMRSSAQANRSRSHVLNSLLQAKRSGELPGIIGRLGDLGGIDAKYDVAISTACGQLDYVVTDTVLTAQCSVEYLKKHDIGLGKFLALEKMDRWIPIMQKKISVPENVPRLFDLVQVKDKSILPAFYFALQDTLVADDLDQATRIGLQGSRRYRVVTLKGELVDMSGTMSGGGRAMRGKMGQAVVEDNAAQVEQLTAQLSTLENKVKDLHERRTILEDKVNALRKDCTASKHALQKFQVEVKGLKQQHTSLTSQLSEQKEKVAKAVPDKKKCAQLEKNVATFKKDYDEAMSSWNEVEEKVLNLHSKIMEITGKCMGSAQQEAEKVRKQLDACLMEITRAESSIKTAERNLKKAESKVTSIEAELEETKLKLDALKKEYAEVEAAAKELLAVSQKAAEELKAQKQKLAEMQAAIDGGKSAETSLNSKQIEVKNQLEQYEATLKDRQAKVARWTKEVKKLTCHAIEGEPEVPLPELDAQALEELDEEPLTLKHAMLKENLASMKPNMAAIQEYKRKEEAYKQRVSELEAVTEKRAEQRRHHDSLRKQRLNEFMRGFAIISSKLKETYQMLTLGGDAELELVDSLDPFSEGIVFSVRPPKKSWKNISNLSGGEKTLSSLALVFALHYYKPTPFYVMDEIDAALDIRNVSIVGYYIKERTRNAQFIIISLRNNMFELSDRLIGIFKVHNCTDSCTINPRVLADLDAPSEEVEASQNAQHMLNDSEFME
ncbi:structural maintenance of chromosomes 4-like protein gluon [Haemaphysalis longicornis]